MENLGIRVLDPIVIERSTIVALIEQLVEERLKKETDTYIGVNSVAMKYDLSKPVARKLILSIAERTTDIVVDTSMPNTTQQTLKVHAQRFEQYLSYSNRLELLTNEAEETD